MSERGEASARQIRNALEEVQRLRDPGRAAPAWAN